MLKKSKFQKRFEPGTSRSSGKHATNTATEASLAMTYSMPLLTHCSYLVAAGTLSSGDSLPAAGILYTTLKNHTPRQKKIRYWQELRAEPLGTPLGRLSYDYNYDSGSHKLEILETNCTVN